MGVLIAPGHLETKKLNAASKCNCHMARGYLDPQLRREVYRDNSTFNSGKYIFHSYKERKKYFYP